MLKIIIMPLLHFCFKNFIYTVRNGLAKGLKRRGGLRFIFQISPLTEGKRFLLSRRIW